MGLSRINRLNVARNRAARLGLHRLVEAPPENGRVPQHQEGKSELIGPAKPESGKSMNQRLALHLETFHW